MRVVLAIERKPLPKQMHYELLLKKINETDNPVFSVPEGSTQEAATDPKFRGRLRQDPAFFFRTPIWSQKFVKNGPRTGVSLRGLFYACHFLSKDIAEFRLHRW